VKRLVRKYIAQFTETIPETEVQRRTWNPAGWRHQPLLANLYMNRFLKYWRITGRSEVFRARASTTPMIS
jgi:hypothetical protein